MREKQALINALSTRHCKQLGITILVGKDNLRKTMAVESDHHHDGRGVRPVLTFYTDNSILNLNVVDSFALRLPPIFSLASPSVPFNFSPGPFSHWHFPSLHLNLNTYERGKKNLF